MRSLRRVHALRADLAEALTPLAHGERPTVAAVEKLNALLACWTASRRSVDPRVLAWTGSHRETRRHCRRTRARRGRHRHEHRPFAARLLRVVRLAVPRREPRIAVAAGAIWRTAAAATKRRVITIATEAAADLPAIVLRIRDRDAGAGLQRSASQRARAAWVGYDEVTRSRGGIGCDVHGDVNFPWAGTR